MQLHDAARNGAVAEVGQLLASGADINAKDAHKRVPLHLAAWAGKEVSVLSSVMPSLSKPCC